MLIIPSSVSIVWMLGFTFPENVEKLYWVRYFLLGLSCLDWDWGFWKELLLLLERESL